MSGWGYFFLFLLLVIIIAPICWIIYTRIRASRAGLPPPPLSSYNPFSHSRHAGDSTSRIYPASRSPLDWIKERFATLRGGPNRSTDSGTAYEPTSSRRGRGVDADEAWDARVGGDEAGGYDGGGGYYEEQELGLHPPVGGNVAGGERGRSLTRGFDEEEGGGDPFGDGAERSELRGVSPRPMGGHEEGGLKVKGDGGDSPTERRSMFREEV